MLGLELIRKNIFEDPSSQTSSDLRNATVN